MKQIQTWRPWLWYIFHLWVVAILQRLKGRSLFFWDEILLWREWCGSFLRPKNISLHISKNEIFTQLWSNIIEQCLSTYNEQTYK